MSATQQTSGAPAIPQESGRGGGWPAVVAIALCIFSLITIEQLPIGVLTLVSDDLQVSHGAVGLAVTFPGVLAAILALLVPGVTARFNRKTVLLVGVSAIVLSCVLAAVSQNYWIFIAARVFTGVAIGVSWPVVPPLVQAQVRAEKYALALSVAFGGIGCALVFGLPLVTWLGTLFGWRGAFVATGGVALLALLAAAVLVRGLRSEVQETIRSTLRVFRVRGVRYIVTLTCILITAHFISYNYISPLLQDFGRVPLEQISGYLLVYGVLGLLGNFLISPVIKRSPPAAVLIFAVGGVVFLLCIALVMRDPLPALFIAAGWGLFEGMSSVSVQGFVGSVSGQRLEAASALNGSAFNLSIGLGAAIGGLIVDNVGLLSAVWVSFAATVLGAALCTRFIMTQNRKG